jgi:hypothetical protein
VHTKIDFVRLANFRQPIAPYSVEVPGVPRRR